MLHKSSNAVKIVGLETCEGPFEAAIGAFCAEIAFVAMSKVCNA